MSDTYYFFLFLKVDRTSRATSHLSVTAPACITNCACTVQRRSFSGGTSFTDLSRPRRLATPGLSRRQYIRPTTCARVRERERETQKHGLMSDWSICVATYVNIVYTRDALIKYMVYTRARVRVRVDGCVQDIIQHRAFP